MIMRYHCCTVLVKIFYSYTRARPYKQTMKSLLTGISILVTILKQLYLDSEKGGVLSESLLKKLEKLVASKILMPSSLVLDLKQYVKDQ